MNGLHHYNNKLNYVYTTFIFGIVYLQFEITGHQVCYFFAENVNQFGKIIIKMHLFKGYVQISWDLISPLFILFYNKSSYISGKQ